MLIEQLLLPGVIVPAVCAALILAASLRWGGRAGDGRGGAPEALRGASLALGAAFASAFVAISGWPRFPPVESTQRLFYWVLVVALLAFVWGRSRDRPAPWPIGAAAIAFLLWGMLRAPIESRWSSAEAALYLAGLLALGFAMIGALAKSLAVPTGRAALEAASVRLAVVGGGAVLLGLSGTARLAQLMGAVACGMLVVELMALRLRRRAWLGGDAMVLVTAVFGLLLGGYFYAELEPWPAALLGMALLALGLASRSAGAWRWLPLLPLVGALLLAGWAFSQQPDDPYDYYGRRPPSVAPADGSLPSVGNTAPRAA